MVMLEHAVDMSAAVPVSVESMEHPLVKYPPDKSFEAWENL